MTPRAASRCAWAAIAVVALGAGFGVGRASRPEREEPQPIVASAEVRAHGAAAASAGGAPLYVGGRASANPLLVPGTSTYDPAAAVLALELEPAAVFAAERRDAAFAERRERYVRDHFGAVIARHAPGVELTTLECRSGSCRAVFEAPADGWSPDLVQIVAWGSVTSVEELSRDDAMVAFEITALMSHELLDHATYERHMDDWRRKMERDLDHLRAQRLAARP